MNFIVALSLTVMTPSQAEPLPDKPGTYELVLETGEESTMRYGLSLPTGYTPDSAPRPLVLSLHYGGHGAPYYGNAMLTGLVEPALQKLNAVMVAPDCPGPNWSAPESERAVLALIDKLVDELAVDPNQVVITGYSLGGMGTWHFISRYPERFAAAIPMAGAPRGVDVQAAGKTPIYAIHSSIDTVVPLQPTEDAISELKRHGADATLVVVDDIPHYESIRFRSLLSQSVEWVERLLATR